MRPARHRTRQTIASVVKRLTKAVLLMVLLLALATTVVIQSSGDGDFEYAPPDTLVNDITELNPMSVAETLRPASIEEVVAALEQSTGPVSIGGGRYSQGGQIAYPDSLHLDMRALDDVVSLDVKERRITVQAGITWREIQEHIDPHDLAVKIMQSYANFTVGGSLSVNVHGRYIGEGPLVRSVESIKLVTADGTPVTATPAENADVFYGAIGGYGGLGVIVEATLALEPNERVERRVTVLPVDAYAEHFRANVRDNADIVFHNADLYPPAYGIARDVSWHRTDAPVTVEARLIPADGEYVWQPRIADWVADSDLGKWLRRRVVDPLLYRSERVAWRNYEASYDVAELEPADRSERTYALREYFVPVARFDAFVARMREIFTRHDANIINVSVRHALPDPGTLLAWADEEVFAFVVYYRQGTTRAARDAVRGWSLELIDAAVELGGTYYLPYQVFASPGQFRAAYPRSAEYFALKARLDPDNRFRNRLWRQHYPPNRDGLEAARERTANYYRGEEQTLLTIPEWYLVFNPVEYADYLESGRNPSAFPFLASIDEFWSLYDRVRAIAAARSYPENGEYLTMLRVIGISTTVEFMLKGAYEATVGRFTRFTAGGEATPEDDIIAAAHRAYSDTIFDVAWYEFDFAEWIGAIWRDAPFFGPNFIRKLERKLMFTAEFGLKTLYAKAIRFASKTAYGEKDDNIYLTVKAPADAGALAARGVEVVAAAEEQSLIAIERWGPFTATLPALAQAGLDFADISGNRQIAVTIVGPAGGEHAFPRSEPLFVSRVLSDPALERRAVLVPVAELGAYLRALDSSAFTLEHIYDY